MSPSPHFFFFPFILVPISCGVDVRRYSPPHSLVVHFLPRQSLLSDIIPHIFQPFSLRSSYPPLYFRFHHPSYFVLLFSPHVHIPLQPPFLNFLWYFHHFRSPLYPFIFCDLQFLFLCLLQPMPISLPRTPVFCTPSPWCSRSFSNYSDYLAGSICYT